MDAELFANMLSDKSILDLKKLRYRYPQADMKEFVALLGNGFYKKLPLKDFDGRNLVYLESIAQVHLTAVKVLLTPQNSKQLYGMKAMEEEILSTFTIEQIATTRDSVHKILSGYAPTTESETRIYGMKMGLEFIGDPRHKINEENIHQLYAIAIGAFLPGENRLLAGYKYRHDSVYIVGNKVKHTGLPWQMLPEYMGNLVSFINEASTINDLLKAAIIHFYIGYLHPWIDGNGRMGRLWQSVILMKYNPVFEYLPVESLIKENQEEYYRILAVADRQGESTIFVEFMLRIVEESLEELLQSQNVTLTGRDRIALFKDYIADASFTRKDYLRYFKELSTATASRDLKEAVDSNQLRKEGEKSLTHYTYII